MTALLGEEFSYQIAYTVSGTCKVDVELKVDSPIADCVSLRMVENVPSENPIYEHDYDDDYLRTEPGLFPDILRPITDNVIEARFSKWHSIWVSIKIPKELTAGDYDVVISFSNDEFEIYEKKTLKLRVINAVLPNQELIFTQWFHTDCIANYYNVPVFSERHWELIEMFVKTAVDNGINMLLTPVFTPPLDTQKGKQRTKVQLVDIYCEKNKYTFNFEKLIRWIRMCTRCGVEYFEIIHLFTQWGVVYTPNIYVFENGTEICKFGWHTAAESEEYRNFLEQFLPEMVKVFKSEGVEDRMWFHISDEPKSEDKDAYAKAKEMVCSILKQTRVMPLRFMDALSDYEFYQSDLVDYPVVALDHMDPFVENNVHNLWGYNCCGQHTLVSNRFMSMPSYRNRIVGFQMFKYRLQGFLHWGYNFYYSEFSKYQIDPFCVTDGLST